jgi:hypothetical protein
VLSPYLTISNDLYLSIISELETGGVDILCPKRRRQVLHTYTVWHCGADFLGIAVSGREEKKTTSTNVSYTPYCSGLLKGKRIIIFCIYLSWSLSFAPASS